jgi:UPF0755 protein
MNKNDLKITVTFIVSALILLVFTFTYPYIKPKEGSNIIVVSKGSTVKNIVDSLYSKKIIYNKTYFYIATYIKNAQKKLKAGVYKIPSKISYLGLVDIFVKGGENELLVVTIPEGIWLPDLAGLLSRKMGLDSTKIMELSYDSKFIKSMGIEAKSLEGYLLPETYFFDKMMDEKSVLQFLVRQNEKIFDSLNLAKMKKLNMTRHEILTLASIIDGESNKFDEFAKISSVYHNRLKRGMMLQADPTIQYLLRAERPKRILFKHLEIKSPYNTYKNYGLPPSPINNPGKQAILAAINPLNTNYYYFVADTDGRHKFATTLSEHNRNVAIYRQMQRAN